MRKRMIRMVGLCLALILLLGQAVPVSAAVPKISAAVTRSNVLALANAYDKDGAYLLKSSLMKGRNILEGRGWTPECTRNVTRTAS